MRGVHGSFQAAYSLLISGVVSSGEQVLVVGSLLGPSSKSSLVSVKILGLEAFLDAMGVVSCLMGVRWVAQRSDVGYVSGLFHIW